MALHGRMFSMSQFKEIEGEGLVISGYVHKISMVLFKRVHHPRYLILSLSLGQLTIRKSVNDHNNVKIIPFRDLREVVEGYNPNEIVLRASSLQIVLRAATHQE
jgi:hypothetical protein